MCPLGAEAQFSTALLDTLATSFQSQMLWALVFLVQVPWAVEPDVGSDPLLPPGGPPAVVMSFPLEGHNAGGVGPD